jgi:hypothetical protein
MFIPGHAPDLQVERVLYKRRTEVTAIFFNGVGRFITPSQEGDDALGAHFSTRKLPITSASIPELKNVRRASVGV